MPLSPGFEFLALDLQEAASLSHGNIRDHLDGAVRDAAGKDGYGYVLDVFGDESSGDVVHRTNGKTLKSKYTIQTQGNKRKATIGDGKPVMPRVVYDEEPKHKEAADAKNDGSLKLVESYDWNKETALRLTEAAGSVRMPMKLIAPGEGSSAFYPAEVLKRDGPNVFTKGTHIYINHATAAEEAARPEGDWHKLVGALESNAYWDDNGKTGPGLYGMGVFTSEAAPLIKEKAPFTGMSIRASGNAEAGKKSKGGKPILKELTSAESVDVVTRAGAGGMILTESLRAKEKETTEMEEKDVKALVESATKPLLDTIAKLQETLDKSTSPVKALEARALRGDATVEATKALSGLALGEASKQRVIESVLRGELPVKDGVLDVAKFTELVTAEAKREAAYVQSLTGGGRVIGMGISVTTETDPAKIAEAQKREREQRESEENDAASVFQRFGLTESAAKSAAKYREVA